MENNTHRFNRYYQAIEKTLSKPPVKAYTTLILSLFTISFFGVFAIKPTLVTIANLKKQIEDAKLVDQKLQEKINALSSASIAYYEINSDLPLIFEALPKEANFSSLVKKIERAVEENNLSFINFSFQPFEIVPSGNQVPSSESPIVFNLIVSGDYYRLLNLIKRFENFRRLLTIERVDFKAEDEKITLSLTGQAYFLSDKYEQ